MLLIVQSRHTSHVTRHTSHVTRYTLHVTRHTSHVTRHTSHVTRHTSHGTRHLLWNWVTSPPNPLPPLPGAVMRSGCCSIVTTPACKQLQAQGPHLPLTPPLPSPFKTSQIITNSNPPPSPAQRSVCTTACLCCCCRRRMLQCGWILVRRCTAWRVSYSSSSSSSSQRK